MSCNVCPRQCAGDRLRGGGFCGASDVMEVARVWRHRGEEPPIGGERGICNVFFSHCNLQCVYCQNHLISSRKCLSPALRGVAEVATEVERVLGESEGMLGLVTPSHYGHLIPELVERLWEDGVRPTVVWNSGGYDSVEMLRRVEPYVDVYLPDLKYMTAEVAERYSHAKDYPEVATVAVKEMARQKGSALLCDERGLAFRGLVVRHLVLPGEVEESKRVLRWIAEELPGNVHLSLMAQYYPPEDLELPDNLRRRLSEEEYGEVVEEMERLGLGKGWVQELASSESYRPHFGEQETFS